MTSETILHLLMTYRYLILFPLAALEGPFIALAAGFLVSLGRLELLPTFAIVILGDIIPDSFYYYVGRFGNRKNVIERYGRRFKVIRTHFSLAERVWRNHPVKAMLFGKLAYGVSIPFLVSAGLVKMPYGKFLLYGLPVTLPNYAIIMAAGYYLGNSYLALAEKYIYAVGILIAAAVTFFFLGYALISKFAHKRIKGIEEERLSEESHE